ncbi:MAG: HpcH/HpaI aldolase family protein [Candidatus Zipacnadales bacterium]
MKPTDLRTRLRANQPVLGTMVAMCRTPEVMVVVARAGMDFVLIDTEHGAFTTETVADLCRVARGENLTAILRVPGRGPTYVSRSLDIGANGLMMPRIETPEEARDVVRWAKYAPLGNRGLALGGPGNDYQPVTDPLATMAEMNESTLIVIQIESKEAVKRVEEIAAVTGIDVLLIGPMDLSATLGVPGQLEHPEFIAAVREVVRAGQAHGVATGIHAPTIEHCLFWKDEGMTFLACSSEVGMIRSGLVALQDRFQSYGDE